MICGFGYLEGRLCGIVSNCSGASTHDEQGLRLKDAQKGSHLVQLCNARDIPMIFLQNSGNNSASLQNQGADECDSITLRERGKLARCVAVSRVPKITVNITGATGDDHFTLCGPSFGCRFYFSWPRAIVRKYDPILNQIEPPLPKAENKESDKVDTSGKTETKKKPPVKLSEYNFPIHSAQYATSRCLTDGIILPRNTRSVLSSCLGIAMRNYVPSKTVNSVRQAAGLPPIQGWGYGAMRI